MNHLGPLRIVLILAVKVPCSRRPLHSRPNGMTGHPLVTNLLDYHDDIIILSFSVFSRAALAAHGDSQARG